MGGGAGGSEFVPSLRILFCELEDCGATRVLAEKTPLHGSGAALPVLPTGMSKDHT